VVSWNNRDLTIDCLDHIAASTVAHRLIVVDNASTDGSPDAIRERFPAAEVVALDENIGFGPAVNRGVAAGSGEFVAIINNDANIEPEFLARVLAPFEDPHVGITGGISFNPSNGNVDAAGILLDRGLGGYLYKTGEPLSEVNLDDPRLVAPAHVHAVYRRAAFEEVEGFDEEIFAYNEEVDLLLRVRGAGWDFAIVPDARSVHIGSASVGTRTLRQVELASWGRGYVAGRYRISPPWLLLELGVGLIDSLRLRNAAPITQKYSGWRRGRKLPARKRFKSVEYVSLRDGLKLRANAF
jgi:GT2 family glycosyltransferase